MTKGSSRLCIRDNEGFLTCLGVRKVTHTHTHTPSIIDIDSLVSDTLAKRYYRKELVITKAMHNAL